MATGALFATGAWLTLGARLVMDGCLAMYARLGTEARFAVGACLAMYAWLAMDGCLYSDNWFCLLAAWTLPGGDRLCLLRLWPCVGLARSASFCVFWGCGPAAPGRMYWSHFLYVCPCCFCACNCC